MTESTPTERLLDLFREKAFTVRLARPLERRFLAYIERSLREDPPDCWDPDETEEERFEFALAILVEVGLDRVEADRGLVADVVTGALRPAPRRALRRRLARAWKELRG